MNEETDFSTFIKNRITELRCQKGISEYTLSLAIGRSQGYIQSISSGRILPSMNTFLDICKYFDITPTEFFDLFRTLLCYILLFQILVNFLKKIYYYFHPF